MAVRLCTCRKRKVSHGVRGERMMMYVKPGRKSIKSNPLLEAYLVQVKPGKFGAALHFSKHNGSWPSAYSSAFIFSRELFLYPKELV